MNFSTVPALAKVAQADNPKYYAIFQQFELFSPSVLARVATHSCTSLRRWSPSERM